MEYRVASANPLDYSSGSLKASPRRSSGQFVVTSVVLDSCIPLPSDPDVGDGDIVYATPVTRIFTSHSYSSTARASLGGHLPTHSRGSRSPSKVVYHHARSGSTSSPHGSPGAFSASNSGRSSPAFLPSAPELLVRANSAADVNMHSSLPTLTLPVAPSYTLGAGDPLLAPTTQQPTNACARFFRAIFILLCCCMTPRHYDSLRSASAARASSPYSSYSRSSAARRNHARDRHRSRQSAVFAATSAAAGGGTGTKTIRSASDSGVRPILPIPPPTWSRDSDSDSELDDDDDESTIDATRNGPCCERPCYPRWCRSRCSKTYTRCCTVRRSACITIYLVLIVIGILWLLYWRWTLRDHGWKWPPYTSDQSE